jgi:small basic protein (TIGR04137 family)
MSIDKSLRRGSRLSRSRNVLKRDERIAQLKADDRWKEGMTALGLPKVRVQKAVSGKKKKEKKEEGDDDAKAKK